MKKRFWLFIYDDYYPGGGMNDFINSFDTLEELKKSEDFEKSRNFDCFQIFDTEENKTVEEK